MSLMDAHQMIGAVKIELGEDCGPLEELDGQMFLAARDSLSGQLVETTIRRIPSQGHYRRRVQN